MATVTFSDGYGSNRRNVKATLTSANDVTTWLACEGPLNILVDGGTTFTIEVYRATEVDFSDDVLVDTQTEAQRAAYYDFRGSGYVMIKLTAVAGGPVVARVTRA